MHAHAESEINRGCKQIFSETARRSRGCEDNVERIMEMFSNLIQT